MVLVTLTSKYGTILQITEQFSTMRKKKKITKFMINLASTDYQNNVYRMSQAHKQITIIISHIISVSILFASSTKVKNTHS